MLVQSVRVAFSTFEPCAISAQWCLLTRQRWLPVPSSVLGSITATRYWLVCQMQTLKVGTCSVLTSTCGHRYACVLSRSWCQSLPSCIGNQSVPGSLSRSPRRSSRSDRRGSHPTLQNSSKMLFHQGHYGLQQVTNVLWKNLELFYVMVRGRFGRLQQNMELFTRWCQAGW